MGGQVIILTAEQALAMWEPLAELAEQALEADTWQSITADEMRDQVATGMILVLLTGDLDGNIQHASFVQIHATRTPERILYVLGTAGEGMEQWLGALIERLQEIAELYQCDAIQFTGRLGWIKALRPFGFKAVSVEMRLDTDGRREQKQAEQ